MVARPLRKAGLAHCIRSSSLSPTALRVYLSVIAAAYSLLAGLRTLTDYDLGWQLATGRWIVVHHQIPSTEVFSYTAQGQPWVYPILSGIAFYLAFKLGGYALLSWMGAFTCFTVAVVLLWRGSLIAAALVILAIPSIAARTEPRADMFTLCFFAVFVAVLWRQLECGAAPMWALPILMVFWVNLHLGFIAGLAAVATYAIAEGMKTRHPDSRRDAPFERMVQPALWLALTLLATLVNPWGWGVYRALLRQNDAMPLHDRWITEWAATPITWESVVGAFNLRETGGSFFILLAVAVLAVLIAVWRRHFGIAVLLAGSSYLAIRHVRLQSLFACVVVIVAGSLLSSAFESSQLSRRWRLPLTLGLFSAFALLAILRSADLISNRDYLRTTGTGSFGAGLSWWFPEGATRFIERERVPSQLFNSYNLGGYLTWRLGPKYPDYIDGRAIPFGPELFRRQDELLRLAPDSLEWQRESDLRGIHSIIVSLARYDGLQFFPVLKKFCDSDIWVPVYLDEVAAVFVRRGADAEDLIRRSRVNCSTTPLPAEALSENRSQRFNQWANAAATLLVLGRTRESIAATGNALAIYPESANVHYIRARALAATGQQSQAAEEYLTAVKLEPSEGTWAALAQMYRFQGNRTAAIDAFNRAAQDSPDPHLIYLALAYTLLEDKRPGEALRAFDRADRTAPSADSALAADDTFPFSVAHGRSLGFFALGDIPRAVSYQEEAIRMEPQRADLWLELSALYELSGRNDEARQAKIRANAIQGGTLR